MRCTGRGQAAPVSADARHFRSQPALVTIKHMIESNPNVMAGKPVVAGTRITVELVLERLGAGESVDQLLESYPRLTRQDILDAIAFAAEALRADVVYPVSGNMA